MVRTLAQSEVKNGYDIAGQGVSGSSSGGGGGGAPSVDYSTDEQLTRDKWIDDKPIYQKTISLTIDGGQNEIPHGISSLDYVVDIKGACHLSFGGGQRGFFPYAYPSTQNGYLSCSINDTNIVITSSAQSGVAPIGNSYITLFYTKTTD